MKLKNILPAFIAMCAALVSCSDIDEVLQLNEVKVSSSYVSIPEEGGETTIELTATGDWQFEELSEKTAAWLTVSPMSGSAASGEPVKVTFKADAALDGRNAELKLTCNGREQLINVIQGLPTISDATCAEVIAGFDGKTYRVTGTVTKIANTTYGNWYLADETGEIYIYGTLDAKGNEKNFTSLGIEVGDEVTVTGPKETYNGTIELKNVTVVNIKKSLIKVDNAFVVDGEEGATELPLEGGKYQVDLACKGEGVSVEIPEDIQSWVSIGSIQSTATGASVVLNVAPNAAGTRSATLTFTTTADGKTYSTECSFTQAGAIVDASIAEFNAAEVGETQYRIQGVISSIYNAEKGRFYVKDYSGETYIYNMAGFADLGLEVGDIVTLVGKRDQYKETIEMTSATLEASSPVAEVTIAEFLTKEDNKEVYFRVSGTISEIGKVDYGNIYITDGSTEERLYIYGVSAGWNYPNTDEYKKLFFATLGLEVGDTISVIGYKTSYKESPQMGGGFYFISQKASNE